MISFSKMWPSAVLISCVCAPIVAAFHAKAPWLIALPILIGTSWLALSHFYAARKRCSSETVDTLDISEIVKLGFVTILVTGLLVSVVSAFHKAINLWTANSVEGALDLLEVETISIAAIVMSIYLVLLLRRMLRTGFSISFRSGKQEFSLKVEQKRDDKTRDIH